MLFVRTFKTVRHATILCSPLPVKTPDGTGTISTSLRAPTQELALQLEDLRAPAPNLAGKRTFPTAPTSTCSSSPPLSFRQNANPFARSSALVCPLERTGERMGSPIVPLLLSPLTPTCARSRPPLARNVLCDGRCCNDAHISESAACAAVWRCPIPQAMTAGRGPRTDMAFGRMACTGDCMSPNLSSIVQFFLFCKVSFLCTRVTWLLQHSLPSLLMFSNPSRRDKPA